MASSRVQDEARKIRESSDKIQHMTDEGNIRNELEKIKQYCSVIESQI